jgi:hypothetical protein
MNTLFLILQSLNTFIFIGISGIHFYWALGGKLGIKAVIPEIEGKSAFSPPLLATIVVALSMLIGAWLSWKPTPTHYTAILVYGNLVIGIIFLLRAIGDFRYVGFTKKVKGSLFAQYDTKYYSPLCLVVASIAFFIYWVVK